MSKSGAENWEFLTEPRIFMALIISPQPLVESGFTGDALHEIEESEQPDHRTDREPDLGARGVGKHRLYVLVDAGEGHGRALEQLLELGNFVQRQVADIKTALAFDQPAHERANILHCAGQLGDRLFAALDPG